MPLAILIMSIAVQFCAAGMALLLIRRTGRISAWVFMAVALFLMAVRRALSFADAFTHDDFTVDPVAEGVALLISVLMLAGVWMIRGVFDSLARLRVDAENQVKQLKKAESDLHASIRRNEEIRKRAEEERQRIQAIENLGTVAGGIAHDFNNVLTSIFGNIELAKMDLSPDHTAFGPLQDAHQTMEEARQLTTRLLTFAKGGIPVLKTVDIRQVIRDTVEANLVGSDVVAQVEVADDLWPVKADAGQIAQVLAALTTNAKEAMCEGGTLRVQARNVPDIHTSAAPELHGDFITLSIRDEGIGMTEQMIEKLFDPYFTTKQAGRGLGLAITYSIISKHKGHISVDSTPNAGTTVTVFLPADTAGRARTQAQAEGSEAAPRVTGHILLMDDEESVRNITSRMLKRLGYTTETACDGREAIEKYATALKGPRPFDLAIMDLTITAGMGGEEAVRELLAINPAAKAIVASGYSSNAVIADYAKHGFVACLTKPFVLRTLEETLAHVLASTPPGAAATDDGSAKPSESTPCCRSPARAGT